MNSNRMYTNAYYQSIHHGSFESAQNFVRILRSCLHIESVLDVGCGYGAWCLAWQNAGVHDFFGVDSPNIDKRCLKIPKAHFVEHDLETPLNLGRRFDLVSALEVAEHLPADTSDLFVASLVRHGNIILFSSAVPGQGGLFHVNEQPYEYWRKKFLKSGFEVFDYIRPRVRYISSIKPWYRYNTFLYISQRVIETLPFELQVTAISPDDHIADISPWTWRLRNRLLKPLPQRFIHQLASLKHGILQST